MRGLVHGYSLAVPIATGKNRAIGGANWLRSSNHSFPAAIAALTLVLMVLALTLIARLIQRRSKLAA